jgi:ribosomal protein S18 acetylase RimI-like enzyme
MSSADAARPATAAGVPVSESGRCLGLSEAAMEIRDLQQEEIEPVRHFLCSNGWGHRLGDADRFRRIVAGSQRTAVAVLEGQIVGFARGVTDGVSNGYLSMVGVDPKHRRKGIGGRLVAHVVGSDRSLTWVLRADREGAPLFFAAIGFVPSNAAMELRRAS